MEKKNLYEIPVVEIVDLITDDIIKTSSVDIKTDDQNANEDIGWSDIF